MANAFAKSRTGENPYVSFTAGDWTWHVLKLYKTPANSAKDQYSRAFCCVVTPMVGEAGELGDVYCRDIPGMTAWLEQQA